MFTSKADYVINNGLSKKSIHTDDMLLNNAGVALWEIDASLLRKSLDTIKKQGVTDLGSFLRSNPDKVKSLLDELMILGINEEARRLFKISNKSVLSNGFCQFLPGSMLKKFTELFIELYTGSDQYSFKCQRISTDLETFSTIVQVKVPDTCVFTWERWLISEFVYQENNQNENLSIQNLHRELEERDKLISIIAHDLKNPFNNILGFSNLLSDKYDVLGHERVKTFLSYINDSATQSYNLLTNLLSWSTTQKKAFEYNPEPINLNETIRENILFLSGSCRKKQISIETSIQKDFTLNTDSNMLNFILRNLLTNAVKFSHRNSTVRVSCISDKRDIEITVSDCGIGMTNEEVSKIFAKGEFCTKKGTENEHGTGLGLKMCKEFVDKMNGSISVSSTPNQGTSFVFRIPVRY